LEQIFVSEGQEVYVGDELFLIKARGSVEHDVEVKRLKQQQNLSNLQSIDSELDYWGKEVGRLLKEFRNLQGLYNKKIISLKDLNDKRSELDLARTELNKVVANKEIALNEQRILEEEIRRAEEESEKIIIAENPGTISELYFKNVGEYIRESNLLCTIVPADSPLYMDIIVANRDIGFIEDNMGIKYKFDAFPYGDYGTLKGKVVSIPPSAVEDESMGWIYRVRGDLSQTRYRIRGKEYPVKVGMTATAELIIERRSIFSLFFRKLRRR
jgi:multidrug efflux pump subunit AcrA (membrane-fusion protein)